MTLKHLVPLGFIAMVVSMSCSPMSPSPQLQESVQPQEATQLSVQEAALPSSQESAQLSPQEAIQSAEPTPLIKIHEATWGDVMTYGALFRDDSDTKIAKAVVEASLSPGQEAYTRYRIGNLAFVEVYTPPCPRVH